MKLTFERRAWCVPTEDRALEGWLEGSPTDAQREAALVRARQRRADWKPDAQAFAQLVQVQEFVGLRIRIQFWDPGTMYLLAEDEWPHPVEANCDGVITLMENGFLQAYLLVRDAVEIKMGGCSGLSRVVERGAINCKLASLAEMYEIEIAPEAA